MDTPKFTLVNNVTLDDMEIIVMAVTHQADKNPTPLFRHRKSVQDLARQLWKMQKLGTLAVFANEQGKYAGLLACNVVELWWIDGPVLVEDLVVSIDTKPNGFGRFAVQILEDIARDNECVMICSGSSMVQDTPIVRNMYKKHGFVVYGESYLKEMD